MVVLVSVNINGGFGLVLDGQWIDEIIKSAIAWDTMGGVARRNWARNDHAIETAIEYNRSMQEHRITIPYLADEDLVKEAVQKLF